MYMKSAQYLNTMVTYLDSEKIEKRLNSVTLAFSVKNLLVAYDEEPEHFVFLIRQYQSMTNYRNDCISRFVRV